LQKSIKVTIVTNQCIIGPVDHFNSLSGFVISDVRSG
jgi:hypothetical protein